MALTVETGSVVAGADSYVSVTFADTFLSVSSSWLAATEAQKEFALKTATAYLDSTFNWVGDRSTIASGVERLEWPRINGYRRSGAYIASTEIPTPLKNAVCVLADYAVTNPLFEVPDDGDGLDSLRVGEISLKYRDKAPNRPTLNNISLIVRDLTVGLSRSQKVLIA